MQENEFYKFLYSIVNYEGFKTIYEREKYIKYKGGC